MRGACLMKRGFDLLTVPLEEFGCALLHLINRRVRRHSSALIDKQLSDWTDGLKSRIREPHRDAPTDKTVIVLRDSSSKAIGEMGNEPLVCSGPRFYRCAGRRTRVRV